MEGSLAVEGVCDRKGVPHLTTTWEHKNRGEHVAVNLYPHNRYQSDLLADLIDAYNWRKMTIMYQDEEGKQTNIRLYAESELTQIEELMGNEPFMVVLG